MLLHPNNISAYKIMSKDFIKIHEDTCSNDIKDILTQNIDKEVLVLDDNNNLIDILTMKDFNILNNKNVSYKSIKKSRKIISVTPNHTLLECRDIMLNENIGHLPVLENNQIVGVIRQGHIRDFLYMGIERTHAILKYILTNIQEAICAIDDKGVVILWNKKSEKLYGISASEIMGKYLKDYFPNAIDVKLLETKKTIRNVYHSPREDYHIIISASPIMVNGKFAGIVSTDKDITEIKKMQTELEEANDLLEFLQREVDKYSNTNFGEVIGTSKSIQEKIQLSKQVAKTNASILIIGESGTGKEVFAKAIHDYSGVKGYFVPVNCGAIPTELFESEFFGYEEGAFTGAKKSGKKGLFELANNGTIFLDEIGDLPLFMQAKLLRVLQEKEIKRVGSEKITKVNVRVISATNKNLKEMVEKGEFREDLYYRINIIEMELPPLRNRKEDIVLLLNHFLKKTASENNIMLPHIDNDVIDLLEKYNWDGNIRELKNTVEHMVVLCRDNTLTKELLPHYIKEQLTNKKKIDMQYNTLDLREAVENLEITLIKEALKKSGGSKTKAAKLLNIPRTTLHSKIIQYNGVDI
ncbi:sigma 54-interacting transcriptional regulator [Clostridiaceae bacterium M8S5]|nr:sigma 54-interacting transcriptional regulator [Clostridiaceae bacterium M8S5]